MHIYVLEREQFIPRSIHEVFDFFSDASNLETLTPPWLNFQILTPGVIELRTGALIDYRLRWGLVPIRWRTEIRSWERPVAFVDFQLRGPYRLWDHTHTFQEVPGGTRMTDVVRYALPLGPLGRLAHWLKVGRDLQHIFDFRATKIAEIFPECGGVLATEVTKDSEQLRPC